VVAPGDTVLLALAKTEQRKDAGSADSRDYRRDRGRGDAKVCSRREQCRIPGSDH